MCIYWTRLAKVTRVLFIAVIIVNLVSFYKDYVYLGADVSFAYIGLILIGFSIFSIFISIFGYHYAVYWAGFFQMILALLIQYDFSNIRFDKPDVWISNKSFYTLSAAVIISFMVFMFKNHTIFYVIINSLLLSLAVIGISFKYLQDEVTLYLVIEAFIYFIILSLF